MKLIRYNILVCLFFSVLNLFSQVKEATWYSYDQEYYKIPVYQTKGEVFTLTYDYLKNNGFPVDAIDPRELQLIHRGKELSVEIEGEADGVFNKTDAIYFYAKENDGKREKELYVDSSYQIHDYYNTFSDTTFYFLTSKNGVKGKRMQTQNFNAGNLLNFSSSKKQDLQVFVENYTAGQVYYSYIFKSELDIGQGFMGNIFAIGASYTINYKDIYLFPGTQPLVLEMQIVGRNGLEHNVDITIGETTKKVYQVSEFNGANNKTVFLDVDPSLLVNNTLKIVVSPKGANGEADAISISYTKLYYNSDFDPRNTARVFRLTPSTDKNVALVNATSINQVYDLTDFYNVSNFQVNSKSVSDKSISFTATDTKEHEFLAFDKTKASQPKGFTKVVFNDIISDDFDYLIITHPAFANEVAQYEQYRESEQGGAYKVKVMMMPDLKLYFNYGEEGPLAIRYFIKHLISLNKKPKFLYLIGNGTYSNTRNSFRNPYYRSLDFYAKDAQGNQWLDNFNYVSVMGYPASDALFTKGLTGDSWDIIPTGRLCVNNSKQLLNYLNKVKEHEVTGFDQPWRKKILHISGGKEDEAAGILANVNLLKARAENPLYGANVKTLTKRTNNEIEFFNIAEPINEGVAVLTYLGHSAANTSEIDIGMISDSTLGYKNKGKYPIHFFNGCHTGEAFNGGYTLMEDWLYSTPNKGSIASFAFTSYAFPEELYQLTDEFYALNFTDTAWFGKSIGEINSQQIKNFIAKRGDNIVTHAHATQLVLYGDPAIKLFNPKFPDYAFMNSDVKIRSFNSEPINAKLDSVQLILPLSNYAKGSSQQIEICIERTYNGTSEFVGPILIDGISNEKNVPITIYNVGRNVAGLNEFKITIDCNNKIQEESKDNNVLTFAYTFLSKGTYNLLPASFAIEPKKDVHFVFQSYLDKVEDFNFQVSKTGTFDSFLFDEVLNGNQIDIYRSLVLEQDTSVYFWRTKPASESEWFTSSFSVIDQKRGWGQFHKDQYLMNQTNNLVGGNTSKELRFSDDSTNIHATIAGAKAKTYAAKTTLTVNKQTILTAGGKNNCTTNGLLLLAFDKKTLKPYHPSGGFNGNCGLLPQIAITINTSSIFKDYLNMIPEGNYVLVQSIGNPNFTNLKKDTALVSLLKKFGSTEFVNTKDNFPYLFVGKRGGLNPEFEVVGLADTTFLDEQIFLKGEKYKGDFTTNSIPVLKSFKRFDYAVSLENKDQLWVDFTVKDTNSNEQILTEFVTSRDSVVFTDSLLKKIDYVSFSALYVDSTNLTIPTNEYFTISHGGMPEYTLVYKESSDTLQFDPLNKPKVKFDFVNLSDVEVMDSLVLEIKYSNDSLKYYKTELRNFVYLTALERREISFDLPSTLKKGITKVEFLLNKTKLPEVSYNNNQSTFYYSIKPDEINPLLSVFFDDLRIKNNDLVSAQPEIKMLVQDLFIYEGVPDTADFKLYIAKVCGNDSICSETKIDFQKDSLIFKSSSDNTLEVLYYPSFQTGKYRLRVQAKDKAGNSPLNEYQIFFQVNEEFDLKIEEPYPNPVFQDLIFEASMLGGKSLPDDAVLKFYDIQGRFVKQYGLQDFKSVAFGNKNIRLVVDLNSRIPVSKGLYFYDLELKGASKSYKKKGRIVFMQ